MSFNFVSAVTIHSHFEAQENKICQGFHFSPMQWSDGTGCYIPTNSAQGSLCSTFLPILVISFSWLIINSHYKILRLCLIVALIIVHFPDEYWCPAPFHVTTGHLYYFSAKISIQFLCPFFKLDFFVVVVVVNESHKFFSIMGIKSLSDIWLTDSFSHSIGNGIGQLFIFIDYSFCYAEAF